MAFDRRQYQTLDLKNVQILIVDDIDQMRKALRRVMSDVGIDNTHETGDVQSAIKILQSTQITLVLCDLNLKNQLGTKILEFIRARDIFNDIPIIMVSGEDGKDKIIKMVSEGADDFIVKPFQIEEIQRKVYDNLMRYLKPPEVTKLVIEGDQAFFKGDYEGALKLYNQAHAKNPKAARITLGQILSLIKLDRWDEAEKKARDGIAAAPEYYKFYRTMADQCIHRGAFDQAIEWLIKELEINPKQEVRQTLLANLYLNQQQPDQALNALKAALLEDPQNFKALMTTAKAMIVKEDIEKAIHYFLRARRAHPKNSEPLQAACEYFYKKKQPEKAEAILKDEIKEHGDRFDAYLLLGQHYLKLQKFTEAEAITQELIKKDKTNEAAKKFLSKIRQSQEMKKAS